MGLGVVRPVRPPPPSLQAWNGMIVFSMCACLGLFRRCADLLNYERAAIDLCNTLISAVVNLLLDSPCTCQTERIAYWAHLASLWQPYVCRRAKAAKTSIYNSTSELGIMLIGKLQRLFTYAKEVTLFTLVIMPNDVQHDMRTLHAISRLCLSSDTLLSLKFDHLSSKAYRLSLSRLTEKQAFNKVRSS